jgi:hypothetical protein
MPVIASDPAASTIETVPTAPQSSSAPEIAPAAGPVLPPFLAAVEPKLPPIVRHALRDGQVVRLAIVISVLVLVLLVLLLVALFR